MTHPSLDAPFVYPDPLKPQRVMNRTEPCWCGSGKKWKQCHRLRESKPQVNMGENVAKMRNQLNKGYCSHPDAGHSICSDQITKAHTVQRRGGLAAIAEEGHVISTESAGRNIFKNDGKLIPSKVGVRSASTFMGFCTQHDTKMFRPVETHPVELIPNAWFLLAFRAISYALYMKKFQLNSIAQLRELDAGMPFETQCVMQQFVNLYKIGVLRGMDDVIRWKDQYDTIYSNKQLDEHRYFVVEFSKVLPVVGCGAFHPEFDFHGKAVQKISHGNATHEHVTFNLTVLNCRSVMVLGWTEGSSGPAEEFAHSFEELPEAQKSNATIQLGFEYVGNLFTKPSWWNDLPDNVKTSLLVRMSSGIGLGGSERNNNCLLPDGNDYMQDVNVVNIFKS